MPGCVACGAELTSAGRFCASCGAPVASGPADVTAESTLRRTVTTVFCDLSGSTSLGESNDPELIRSIVMRYFAVVREAMERYGGTVEKFIGDAVVSIFGVPDLHEDDAVRALRAADAARAAVAGLSDQVERAQGVRLAVRLGVETGEVVVGVGSRGTVATGDAVNVAARLEQAASPGEILVGPTAWALVREVALGSPVEPFTVRGKVQPVAAWRLDGLLDERTAERRLAGHRLVGRDLELDLLQRTFERTHAERACHLVTLIGVPGVGKTRLVSATVEGLPAETVVLRGRCLPYGDAVGLWPLREVVRGAATLNGDVDDAQLPSRLSALLAGVEDAPALVERLGVVAGLPGSPPTREETSWAVRNLLEALGRTRPVVVVVDDVQWADPELVAVLEQVADWTRDAALLLVCVARPELLDDRPTWGGGRVNATSLLLSPLGGAAADDLLVAVAGGGRLERDLAASLVSAAAGVPLYAEHLFEMLVEQGRIREVDGTWAWADGAEGRLAAPPTIAAILGARLDQLDRASRLVLEAAAVVGEVFYRGAVVELAEDLDPAEVDAALGSLLRRQLVRPEQSDIDSESALRFVHLLVQDVAYGAMSKSTRAQLHVRLARWLAKRSEAAPTVDAFVGHHLASAVELRDAIGARGPETHDLAREAVEVLRRAACRVEMTDKRGAAALLDRAAGISDDPAERTRLHLRRSLVLRRATELLDSLPALQEAARAAQESGDPRLVDMVRVSSQSFASQMPELGLPATSDDELESYLERYRDDDEALVEVLVALLNRGSERATWEENTGYEGMLEQIGHRRGDALLVAVSRLGRIDGILWGPTPAAEGLGVADALLADPLLSSRDLQVNSRFVRAVMLAMLGRYDEGRHDLELAEHIMHELRLETSQRTMGFCYGYVLLGDLDRAEHYHRDAIAALERMGEVGWLSTFLPMLGEIRLARGDVDEARELARRSREIAPPLDIDSNSRWRSLHAQLLTRDGEHDEAVRAAREAVAWAERGDQLDGIGDRYVVLAEALAAGGDRVGAREAYAQALDRYRRKGHVAAQRRVEAAVQLI